MTDDRTAQVTRLEWLLRDVAERLPRTDACNERYGELLGWANDLKVGRVRVVDAAGGRRFGNLTEDEYQKAGKPDGYFWHDGIRMWILHTGPCYSCGWQPGDLLPNGSKPPIHPSFLVAGGRERCQQVQPLTRPGATPEPCGKPAVWLVGALCVPTCADCGEKFSPDLRRALREPTGEPPTGRAGAATSTTKDVGAGPEMPDNALPSPASPRAAAPRCICSGRGECPACRADVVLRLRERLTVTRRLDECADADCRAMQAAVEALMARVAAPRCPSTWRGRQCVDVEGHDGIHYAEDETDWIEGDGHGATARPAAAPDCPVREAAERAVYDMTSGLRTIRLRTLAEALAAPCTLAGTEPTEAAIDAGLKAECDHASHMENDATRCVCACGAIFDDKPEIDADDQQRRHWLLETLKAAFRAQFGLPAPKRGTAANKEETR